MAKDIASSDIFELADWCAQLGLSETGAIQELRSRLYDHYKLRPPPEDKASNRVIEVVSASKADYFKVEAVQEQYLRFSGGVKITLTESDKGWVHEISADQIVFNQDMNLLSARGNVNYLLKRANGEERFSGEKIDVDLNTWTGDFLKGRVQRSGDGATGLQTKFAFVADDVWKGGGDLVVFDDAIISSSGEDEPNYSIRASRTWILGKNEWAMLNPVLSVGEVPLLYLPFFYYTGEELLLHPAIGVRTREGSYANLTYYVMGRKAASSESISLLQLSADTSNMEKEVHGLYLLSTDKRITTRDDTILKVMLDAYANLGVFAGVEFHAPTSPRAPKVDILGILALTRNLYSMSSLGYSGYYTPYVSENDYQSVWNGSTVFGANIPLRVALELGASYRHEESGAYLNLSLPFYSDSYVDQEFKQRSENMSLSSFLDGSGVTEESSSSRRSSILMQADGSWTPKIESIKPYLSNLAISLAKTQLSWNSKATYELENGSYSSLDDSDPERYFYYPEVWTMFSGAAIASGTIFSWPPKAKTNTVNAVARPDGQTEAPGQEVTPDDFASLPDPRNPWADEKADEASTGLQDQGQIEDYSTSPLAIGDLGSQFRMRQVEVAVPSVLDRQPFSFGLNYDLSGSAVFERSFNTDDWMNSEEIDWGVLYDNRLLKWSGNLRAQAAVLGSLATANASLAYNSQTQEHGNFTEDSEALSESAILLLQRSDYQARSEKLSATVALGSKPFQDVPLFAPTSLSYQANFLIRYYRFSEMDGETPIYTTTGSTWDSDGIPSHSLSMVLGAVPYGNSQSFTINATLPPLDASYQASLQSQLGPVSLGASGKYYYSSDDERWYFDSARANAVWRINDRVSLSDTFAWSIEDEHPESNSTNLNLWDLGATFSMAWDQEYSYDSGNWLASGDYLLRPDNLSVSYRSNLPTYYFWRDRLSLKLSANSSLAFDFQRFTESYLSFDFKLESSLSKFMDISFSTNSQNTRLYRYLVGLPGFEVVTDTEIDRVNILEDLVDSFNFFSLSARKSSAFKLKKIKVSLVHHMGDWDLTASYTGTSELEYEDNVYKYVFSPEISMVLTWVAIPEIKSTYTKTSSSSTLK